jgi:hypothetical protein
LRFDIPYEGDYGVPALKDMKRIETSANSDGRLNANERVIRRVPNSPQFGGASSIPQTATTYGIVTSASS